MMYAAQWIWAGMQILGGVALIGAAILAVETSAVALVTFANGLDLIIHGITTIIRILDGEDSSVYHTWVAISAFADLLVITADIVVAAVLTGGLGAEASVEAVAPLVKNSEALGIVGAFLGVDLKAAWDDFMELFSFKRVNN